MGLESTDIVAGLQEMGLSQGDLVEVHSSLSSLGWVEGGAETVIRALIEVVGESGTIVMSAYNVSPALPVTEEEQARGIGWKVRLLDPDSVEPTGMGVVSDTFRRRTDVVCGTGVHRTCAWGRDAAQHAEGYENLVEADGWVLLVGVDIYRCSSLHVAERVPIPEAITAHFRIPDEILRDYPEDQWGIGYGGVPGDPWGTAWREAQERGLIRTMTIGQAECHLFKAKEMVLLYEDLRRSDPYGLFGLEEA
jgi:aminoglycoside N3'-acetyltransferase